jgi:hypothetical protein
VTRNLEIVDVLIPVRTNVVYRRHAEHYTIGDVPLRPDATIAPVATVRLQTDA